MAAAHTAPKKVATNLSLRTDLVRRAKALGLNISELVDTALEAAIRRAEQETWLAENREAMAGYNEQVEQRGVFSDEWRRF